MAWVISDETMERVRELVFGSDYIPSVLGDIVREGEQIIGSLVWTTADWDLQIDLWENYERPLTLDEKEAVLQRLRDEYMDVELEVDMEGVNDQLQDVVTEAIEAVLEEGSDDQG